VHTSPDARSFAAFLARAHRRARAIAACRGAAIGLAIAAVLVIVGAHGESPAAALAGAATLATLGLVAGAATVPARRVPLTIEQRTPSSRNLIFTAAELLGREPAAAVAPYMAARVWADAVRATASVDLRRALPARGAVGSVLAALVVWSATLAGASGLFGTRTPVRGPSSATAATIVRVDIEVTPPDYAGQPKQTLRDPARIEALAGSRLRVVVRADAATLTLDTVSGSQPFRPSDGQSFSAELQADADGYLAIAPMSATGAAGVRRLIGLSVTPDHAPRVRVTSPGKDLRLANGQHTLPFAIEAEDDLGLASLRLHYTRVAGSGETFTFSDGDVPVDLTRTSDRAWTAHGTWALASLGLEPGDMVIYRGVATDRRPGAPPAESDAFIVEITAPGSLPSEGFAIDDRMDKYAISQQMVIIKTERLLAARATMAADDFRREAEGIAAEQRQVRAEFVFMMGGELADAGLDLSSLNEEVEAAGEDDLAAGRLANRGRADLVRAIRSMSRAAAQLATPDVVAALPTEKEALTYLQSAFSRSRYILRTLSERERIDLSRRLTGVLAALARATRPAAEAAANPRITALRRILADVATLSADPNRSTGAGAARASALAEQVLRLDPATPAWRDAAAALTRAAAALASNGPAAAAQVELDRAAAGLAALARAELPADPVVRPNAALDELAGALTDALRQTGRRR